MRSLTCFRTCNPSIIRSVFLSTYPNSYHDSSAAFSLLEMVIVVAILGILTAVSMPALMGNTDRARIVAAKVAIQNVLAECAVAKQEGFEGSSLILPSEGGSLNVDIIPSFFSKPDGYSFDTTKGGCHAIYLVPDVGTGSGSLGKGYPILQAKLASRGRVIKAFQFCQATSSVDLTKECESWDSTGLNIPNCEILPTLKERNACRSNYGNNTLSANGYSSNRVDLNLSTGSWAARM
jgi:prepilin-type N-terminal cleavage/methylation domain-containing protein